MRVRGALKVITMGSGRITCPSQVQRPRAILVSLGVPLYLQRMAGAGPRGTVKHTKCARRGRVGGGGEWAQPSLCLSNHSPRCSSESSNRGHLFCFIEKLQERVATSFRAEQFNPPSSCQVKSSLVQKSGCTQTAGGGGAWSRSSPGETGTASPSLFVFLCVISPKLTKMPFLWAGVVSVELTPDPLVHPYPRAKSWAVSQLCEATPRTNPVWVQDSHGGHLPPPLLAPQRGSFWRTALPHGRLGSPGLQGHRGRAAQQKAEPTGTVGLLHSGCSLGLYTTAVNMKTGHVPGTDT